MTKDNKQSTATQLPRFIVTGLMAVATDYISYLLLANFIAVDFAKGSSFILGSVVAFVLNKLWTFESEKKASAALLPFIMLYSSTFCVNVGLNHFTLVYVSDIKTLAFLVATAASTILNFLGMKFWVFKASQPQGSI